MSQVPQVLYMDKTLTSLSALASTDRIELATGHFFFITRLFGGSCGVPASTDQMVTLAPPRTFDPRENLKASSSSPAIRVSCHPVRLISSVPLLCSLMAAVEKLSFHLAVSSLSRRDLHFKAPTTPTHLAKRKKKQLQSCSCEQQESR